MSEIKIYRKLLYVVNFAFCYRKLSKVQFVFFRALEILSMNSNNDKIIEFGFRVI